MGHWRVGHEYRAVYLNFRSRGPFIMLSTLILEYDMKNKTKHV